MLRLSKWYCVCFAQLDGSLIQSGSHDYYETGVSPWNSNESTAWSPPLCDRTLQPLSIFSPTLNSEADCLGLTGCVWSDGKCSGFPTNPMQPPDGVFGEATPGLHQLPKPRYGVKYRYNWVHDSRNDRTSKRGLRFDRTQEVCNGRFANTWLSRLQTSSQLCA